MKIKIIFFSILTLFITSIAFTDLPMGQLYIDDLSASKINRFPAKWRTWPFQRKKAKEVYHVKEENGKKYIHAFDNKNISAQAMKDFYWKIDKYPYLSWKWRAKILPEGAKEDDDSKNDSACGVYVIIGKWKGHAIKYAWSSSLPKNKVVTRRDGKLKIKIIETGKDNLNTWQQVKVHVPKDYKKLFNTDLNKNPTGIAILTDGNAVYKPAACDYTDFIISDKPI